MPIVLAGWAPSIETVMTLVDSDRAGKDPAASTRMIQNSGKGEDEGSVFSETGMGTTRWCRGGSQRSVVCIGPTVTAARAPPSPQREDSSKCPPPLPNRVDPPETANGQHCDIADPIWAGREGEDAISVSKAKWPEPISIQA